ncbi:hypothetical protein LTR17_003694 [Elasticomyces elasticus]|nr:hypothetical protein LTR17_003694 [Elasticomyces elasticus]KAK5754683.1 hypothetical protein LTS12_015288 [Elasticomyces elasticus]
MSDQTHAPQKSFEEIIQDLGDHYIEIRAALIKVRKALVVVRAEVEAEVEKASDPASKVLVKAGRALVIASTEVKTATDATIEMHETARELVKLHRNRQEENGQGDITEKAE